MEPKDENLFGEPVVKDVLLRDKFIEPPFSILDTRQASWRNRRRNWEALGMRSEIGRDKSMTYAIPLKSYDPSNMEEEYYGEEAQSKNTSIFDPALTELMYHWFCPEKGKILDPFAGGSVRGIVAEYLGFRYHGIELRKEQVESNKLQAIEILPLSRQPLWVIGDSERMLEEVLGVNSGRVPYDFIFSCPPYADLEVYSDHPDDLSNMDYVSFIIKYRSIIKKAVELLKKDHYACFVVGEVRNKKNGFYYDFVGDTKRAFVEAGCAFYNDAILLNSVGSASMRSRQFEASKKLVKIHQNVLVFKKL